MFSDWTVQQVRIILGNRANLVDVRFGTMFSERSIGL